MTKAELIERVAVATDVTKKQAETIVDTVFEAIIRSLKEGQKIELRGFGSFRLRERGARIGRNPKTGVKVNVPAKKIPYFKPGKELKELINSLVAHAGRPLRSLALRVPRVGKVVGLHFLRGGGLLRPRTAPSSSTGEGGFSSC